MKRKSADSKSDYEMLPSEPKPKRGLVRKTPLKAKTPLKSRSKPKKQPKPTITFLRQKADKLFSKYVRLRDSTLVTDEEGNKIFIGTCITCSYTRPVAWIDSDDNLRFTKGWDAGHFLGRGNLYLRYDEENVNLQCKFRCNKMRSGEPVKYRLAVDMKYGDGTATKLEMAAAINRNYHFTAMYLEEIIQNSITQIDFYRQMM